MRKLGLFFVLLLLVGCQRKQNCMRRRVVQPATLSKVFIHSDDRMQIVAQECPYRAAKSFKYALGSAYKKSAAYTLSIYNKTDLLLFFYRSQLHQDLIDRDVLFKNRMQIDPSISKVGLAADVVMANALTLGAIGGAVAYLSSKTVAALSGLPVVGSLFVGVGIPAILIAAPAIVIGGSLSYLIGNTVLRNRRHKKIKVLDELLEKTPGDVLLVPPHQKASWLVLLKEVVAGPWIIDCNFEQGTTARVCLRECYEI